jgi:hypothetical protein
MLCTKRHTNAPSQTLAHIYTSEDPEVTHAREKVSFAQCQLLSTSAAQSMRSDKTFGP